MTQRQRTLLLFESGGGIFQYVQRTRGTRCCRPARSLRRLLSTGRGVLCILPGRRCRGLRAIEEVPIKIWSDNIGVFDHIASIEIRERKNSDANQSLMHVEQCGKGKSDQGEEGFTY